MIANVSPLITLPAARFIFEKDENISEIQTGIRQLECNKRTWDCIKESVAILKENISGELGFTRESVDVSDDH